MADFNGQNEEDRLRQLAQLLGFININRDESRWLLEVGEGLNAEQYYNIWDNPRFAFLDPDMNIATLVEWNILYERLLHGERVPRNKFESFVYGRDKIKEGGYALAYVGNFDGTILMYGIV